MKQRARKERRKERVGREIAGKGGEGEGENI